MDIMIFGWNGLIKSFVFNWFPTTFGPLSGHHQGMCIFQNYDTAFYLYWGNFKKNQFYTWQQRPKIFEYISTGFKTDFIEVGSFISNV